VNSVTSTRDDLDNSAVEILFLDVGQGDATLAIDWQTQRALLVDCPAGKEAVVEDAVESRGISLDTAIISHWDADHYGGIIQIVDSLGVRSLRYNYDTFFDGSRSARALAVHRRLADERYSHLELGGAEEGVAGKIGNLSYSIAAPSRQTLHRALVHRDRNLASSIVFLEAHGSKIIVAGDADGRVWKALVDNGVSLNSDVLRWPHHGAMTHTNHGLDSATLLQHVSPSHVIVSVGSHNRYRHPQEHFIDTIRDSHSRVMCTEVTPLCHNLSGREAKPCAGTVSVRLRQDGGILITPSLPEHTSTISSWNHPRCLAST